MLKVTITHTESEKTKQALPSDSYAKILKLSDREIKITMITMLMNLVKKLDMRRKDCSVNRETETLTKNQKKS